MELIKNNIKVIIESDAEELGKVIARLILVDIEKCNSRNQKFLLGCPAGRSCREVFAALGAEAVLCGVDMSRVIIVMMDEYVEFQNGCYKYCPEDAHYSCRRFAQQNILQVINISLAPKMQIPRSNLWVPSPSFTQDYDKQIHDAGGINVFLIASGASDGHVAFNPPGSSIDSPTRIIELPLSLRRDNIGTFPLFKNIEEVPLFGVGVGLGTIRNLSQSVFLVIHGSHKRKAVETLFSYNRFSPQWPATVIYECKNPLIFLDKSASEGII